MVRQLISKSGKDEDVMRRELKKGEFSLYSMMMQPDLKLAGKDQVEDKGRTDILCELTVGDREKTTNTLHWCKGNECDLGWITTCARMGEGRSTHSH